MCDEDMSEAEAFELWCETRQEMTNKRELKDAFLAGYRFYSVCINAGRWHARNWRSFCENSKDSAE